MNRWIALILACLALGIVVAGCGSDDDGGGGDAQNTEQPAEGGSVGGGGGGADEGGGAERGGKASDEVVMQDIEFKPSTIRIGVGDTVTWKNEESVGHDVTADDFKSGDPGGMGEGDTFEHTFDEAGSFDYVCTVHPGMEGTVEVQ